jgi:hypothetical protein
MMRIRTFLLVLSVDIIAGLKIQVNTKAGEIHGFVQKTTFQNQTGSVVTFLGRLIVQVKMSGFSSCLSISYALN